jgi:hypothetical protein
MQNTEHPAYQRAERKLRRFCGILYNFEKLLRDDGFDYDEASKWWYGEWQKLNALEEANDPARETELRTEEQRVEAELYKRMDHLIKFLYARAPDHPWLPPYRLYMALWHKCYGEPIRTLSEEDLKQADEAEEIIVAPTIYGVPFERLDAARLEMGKIKLPHKDMAPLVMFLCGLYYAVSCQQRQTTPQHDFDDGLREAARESLEEAIDFASEPGTIAEAERHDSEIMTQPFSRLFMAISYASRQHTPAVYEWLTREAFTRDLTSMLFAMGVRAFTDPYSQTLVKEWSSNPGTALTLLPPPCAALIASFAKED